MTQVSATSPAQIGIALVDGDATIRRNRQLMLRAENFEVRSYATCAAMIADPHARASACVVVDDDMPEISGAELLREMRVVGWQGSGILLRSLCNDDARATSADVSSDAVLSKTVADRPLLDAIRLMIKRDRHRAAGA